MSEQALNSQDVIGLLSKLKDSTPDYPIDLMAARKAAFMKEAIAIQIHERGMSGKGGGDGGSGGSGTLGGMSTAQTILLQAVIGVWIVAAMLTVAYVFRDRIIDLLRENGIVTVEITQAPFSESAVPATIAPATEVPSTEITPLAVTVTPGAVSDNEAPVENQDVPDDTKDNPGLHLGQTPGVPDPPDQNKPDKPDKPDKLDKQK